MLSGITFELRTPTAPSTTARADVAAFVGLLTLRAGRLPADVLSAWRDAGFGDQLAPNSTDPDARPTRPLPIAVENVAAFDALFDGWVRTDTGLAWEAYTAGAVRDFFRQGGRRAWIIAVGEPAAPSGAADSGALAAIVPALASFSASERDTWHGLGHLLGLPEVATACVPDWPMLVGAPLLPEPPLPGEAVGSAEFAECSEPDPRPPLGLAHRAPLAPRLGDSHFDTWQSSVRAALAFIARYRPDVQLVASLPLWEAGHAAVADPLSGGLANRLRPYADGGLGSARLQLAYPWLSTDASRDRPGELAPPDGVFAGLIARSVLEAGAFRPLTGLVPEGVSALVPALSPRAVRVPRPAPGGAELSLMQRVSMISALPRGYRVISDVTTSSDPAWRQAGVNRLMGLLRRAYQRIGESFMFEPSGPQTWRRLRRRTLAFLEALRAEGAFADGPAPYDVRCDRTTMTQSDIDDGRMIARVEVTPAQTIERIAVVLAIGGASGVSVRDGRAA